MTALKIHQCSQSVELVLNIWSDYKAMLHNLCPLFDGLPEFLLPQGLYVIICIPFFSQFVSKFICSVRNRSRQCQFCVLQYRRDQDIVLQYSCYKTCYSWFCMYKCWNTTKFPFHSYLGSNEKITIFFSYFQLSVIHRN